MPSVLNVVGYRIMIFTDDHEPPHMHVFQAGCLAIVLLNCPAGPPTLRQSKGFKERHLRKIFNLIQGNIELLCQNWEQIHVQP